MRHSRAFSLLIVLLLMSGLAAFVTLLVALSPVMVAEQAGAADRSRLRQEALGLLRLALAEVQAAAGTDQVATWMDGEVAVASRRTSASREEVRLSGERTLDGTRWRWRCEDISCGHDLSGEATTSRRASPWARGQVARQLVASGAAASMPGETEALAGEWGDEAIYRAVTNHPARPGESWGGWGLLTDPVRGGWKRDLGVPSLLSALVGPEVATALAQADLREERAAGLPLLSAAGPEHALRHVATLVDLRLSLGFFNARSDGRHRMRFHVSGLLWNPSSAPLLAEAEGRLYLLEIVGAPEVSVRNLDSGAGFLTDLDECPVGDFGIFSQHPREAGLWAWIDVADAARHGMSRRGLLPGECYAFLGPSPAGQPQGLSRVLTAETWRYENTPRGRGWRRPSPQVFLPDDRIEISVRFVSPLTLRLRRVVGEPARDLPIGDYPGPIVQEIGQIWFRDFKCELSGRDYSRSDSAGYTLAERRACLRLSWIPRSWAEIREAVRRDGLLRDRWDLSQPEQASCWEVREPLAAASASFEGTDAYGVGVLRDAALNLHLAETPGAYADLRLREVPGWPLLSVGALRHLRREMDWARLDDSFASAPLRVGESGRPSENPRLSPGGGAPGQGEGWMVSGPFNVNSADAEAWAGWLRACSSPWQAGAGGPFAPATLRRPFWPLQPAGAHLAQWVAGSFPAWTDEELARVEPEQADVLSARQPVRFPDERKIVALARELVRLRSEAGAPFASLEAFARSGLLKRALAAARCNDVPGAADGGWLAVTEDDLLEQWAPHLTVRGDTLRLVGQVAFVDPRRRGAQGVEAILQRTAAMRPDGRWGRVWRVMQVRFL
ncbi:MAG: hypothetical protein ACKO3A_06030 [Opitutia bacterium]